MEEEKKRQSTIQPEQIQGFNSLAEDELSLIDLLKFLARKKKFIFTITSVFTLCSIFYVQSITPIYRATVSLLNHKEGLSPYSILEKLDHQIFLKVSNETKPNTIFERFLLNIKSYEFRQAVFVNGGFQKKFFRETGIDTDQSVSAIYNSTKIVKEKGIDNLELEGSKPKVMLEFLTALVEAAKENTNTEINDIVRSVVKARINNLSTQIEELHQKITVQKQIENQKSTVQKQIEKEKKIARLSKALDMAKRMGIKNNNFDKPDNGSAPVWFRYGELALQQEIKSLKIQQEIMRLKSQIESPTTIKLNTKTLQLKKLQSADLPPLKFKVVTIGEHSYFLVKPNQPWVIIGFGVALGLFISIFMAFLIDLKNS